MAKRHFITIPKKVLIDKSITKIHANDLPKKKAVFNSYTTPPPQSEHELQVLCHNFIRDKYPNINSYSIPNGAKTQVAITKEGKEINFERMWLVAEGMTKGVADYFVAKAKKTNKNSDGFWHGLYIEFKFGEGKQSKEQIAFEKMCTRDNYLYIIVYENDSILDANGSIDPLLYFKKAFLEYIE